MLEEDIFAYLEKFYSEENLSSGLPRFRCIFIIFRICSRQYARRSGCSETQGRGLEGRALKLAFRYLQSKKLTVACSLPVYAK